MANFFIYTPYRPLRKITVNAPNDFSRTIFKINEANYIKWDEMGLIGKSQSIPFLFILPQKTAKLQQL
jgi:hypothetical protein